MHTNERIEGHTLVGQTFTYHAEYPPYDPDRDNEGGQLLLANGFPVVVKAVFQNWNGHGSDMLYVFVPATGMHTHILPADLGLGRIKGLTVESGRMFDTERVVAYALSDCQWWDQTNTFDCWGRVGKTGDGMYSVLCEGHLNNKAAR